MLLAVIKNIGHGIFHDKIRNNKKMNDFHFSNTLANALQNKTKVFYKLFFCFKEKVRECMACPPGCDSCPQSEGVCAECKRNWFLTNG
jgi:hypothetical protein